ncbi:MAG TPA: hypothetical protein ENI67_06405 [Gammaproteobacteria bacterium]|nr:hypothetical protein [Gammaproteobacteria bacterium]
MKIVKVVTTGGSELSDLFLRQTAKHSGIWDDCYFYVNQHVKKCDWLVVCHSSALKKSDTALCDPDHIVYISMEPHDHGIPDGFFKQFSKLVLCDRSVSHPDIRFGNGLTWWVGINVKYGKGHVFSAKCTLDYDRLKTMKCPDKQNRISVICSKKNLMSGHQKRLDFILKLQGHPICKYIDFYGGGYHPIPDKWDAIAPYKYHLVLENSIVPDYWSEKLGDAFLGFAFPIYYGCPNIHEYFSSDALQVIDIEQFDKTVSILEKLISQDSSEYQSEAIYQARTKVLNQYNIFQIMADICDEPAQSYQKCKLIPPRYFLEAWLNKCTTIISKVNKRIVG